MDFFAYYDHRNDFGMVHWADPADVKGKKLWAWKKEDRHHCFRLGAGSGFLELQSGRDEDQEVFEILAPFATVSWNEVWFAVANLGTVSNASENLAMAVASSESELTVKFQSTKSVDGLDVIVAGGENSETKKISLRPGKIGEVKFTHPNANTITAIQNNTVLIRHNIENIEEKDLYIDKIADDWPATEDRNTDCIMKEIRWQMRRFPQKKFGCCLSLLEEILRKDPDHAEALKMKGIFLYEKGLFAEAILLFTQSQKRNPFDPEAYYYTGLANFHLGNNLKSDIAFGYAAKYGMSQTAWFWRAMLATKAGNCSQSLEFFQNAVEYNGWHTKARVYLALLLNKNGATSEAFEEIKMAEKRFPSDPLISIARYWLEYNTMSNFRASLTGSLLAAQLHGDIQTWYQSVLDMAAIGLNDAALQLLEEIKEICKDASGAGMLPYYIYYFASRNGIETVYPSTNSIESILYTFPFRFEEIEILDFALARNPSDKFALYYKGLIMGGLARYEEAYVLIKRAYEVGLEHPVVCNILGKIAGNTPKDLSLSRNYYAAALKLDPNNIFALNSMADLLLRAKEFSALEEIFKHPSAMTNIDLFSKRINHLNRLNQLDKAITLYKGVDFSCMDQSLSPQYFNLLEKRGIGKIRCKEYDAAIEDFRNAQILPRNLGEQFFRKRFNLRAEYFLGKALQKKGNIEEAEKIWRNAINEQEQRQDWTLSGAWNYGFWSDRFFQGWMHKELGHKAEAITYFDAIRAVAAHKFKNQFSPVQRRDLLKMAYNGLNDEEIFIEQADQSYLSKE